MIMAAVVAAAGCGQNTEPHSGCHCRPRSKQLKTATMETENFCNSDAEQNRDVPEDIGPDPPTSGCRWSQFRLSTLLLLILVAALAIGWSQTNRTMHPHWQASRPIASSGLCEFVTEPKN
jgi:hypothetical protein